MQWKYAIGDQLRSPRRVNYVVEGYCEIARFSKLAYLLRQLPREGEAQATLHNLPLAREKDDVELRYKKVVPP